MLTSLSDSRNKQLFYVQFKQPILIGRKSTRFWFSCCNPLSGGSRNFEKGFQFHKNTSPT